MIPENASAAPLAADSRTAGVAGGQQPATPTSAELADLVAAHGLRRAGARPPLAAYTRELWSRRHFISAFATANNAVGYSTSFLGQAWQLLTPLLNIAVYYLIFGVLLHTSRGVHNFIAFLVIGIFVFSYTQTSVVNGARAVSGNLQLTRVLRFPRAALPFSATLVALEQFAYSVVILIPVVLVTGEPFRWNWVLVLPAVVLQTFFCLGLALIVARLGAKVPDTSQFLPFILRTWMFGSGVFYSIHTFAHGHAHWVLLMLQWNPGFVYVDLVREALLTRQPHPPHQWWIAAGWAVVTVIVGYYFFWQAEEEYGRD